MLEPSHTRPIRILLGASALILLGACGGASSQVTPQLVSARRVVQHAQTSNTARLAPRKMDEAWQAYVAAERAHKKDPGSYREAHLAYVAQRKAEAANASANLLIALRTKHILDTQYQAKLNAPRAKPELEAAAEPTASDALEALQDVADVKQTDNTVVITLSSAVLFPTAGDTLSDSARTSLDRVAHAIEAQPEGSRVRVDGYTDSRGTDTYNEALSKRRAKAVSDYLAQQGVENDKLSAEGRGESDPIASNDTEDGRATNRRAEIVIELAQTRPEAEPTAKPAASNKDKGQTGTGSSAKGAREPIKEEDNKLLVAPPPPHEPRPGQ